MADFIDAFRDIETPEPLYPCSSCGRKFIADTLLRHEKICANLKKRKPFDSSKQRRAGIPESEKAKSFNSSPTKTKKNNWKQKHEDFINTIRSARGVTAAIKKGDALPPPPPQRIDPDLVPCPHCGRRFNEHSAERHIQFCKDQKSRIGKSPGSASTVAAQRVAARTKYKPPSLVKRPPSGTTLTSSGKARQTKTKSENASQLESNRVLRHDERPISIKKQGNNAKRSHETATMRQDSKQTLVGQKSKASSAGNSRRLSTMSSNGQQSSKTYYSNRYTNIDNEMEVVDSGYEILDASKAKEIRYGRRASKTQEFDGTTDYMFKDTIEHSNTSGLTDKGLGSVTNKKGRRNITVRDASPTLFDDFGMCDEPSGNRKNPFPPKAQVHRTNAGDLDSNGIENQRRRSKFCHECGTKYPVTSAKFCCECGTKRLHIN